MANPLQLLPQAVGQQRPQIVQGMLSTVQPAPASFSDPLSVVFPSWSPDVFFTVRDWPACHGSTLPAPGAECLLLQDSSRAWRCVWWDGDYTTPATPPAVLDTGWVELPLAAYASGVTGSVYYRIYGQTVYLRGMLSALPASGTLAFTMPTAAAAAYLTAFAAASYEGGVGIVGAYLQLNPGGEVYATYAGSPSTFFVGGSYLIN